MGEFNKFLPFAQQLAYQAGPIIKSTKPENLRFELKADHTPVTDADKRINRLVIEAIRARFPSHGVLGEEDSSGNGEEDYLWVCDPLDGTRNRMLGMKLSTFILGLAYRGEMQIAVVYDPFDDEMYHAVRGQDAFCNNSLIGVNQLRLADGGFVLLSESSYQFEDAVNAAGGLTEPVAGAGYRAMNLASGYSSGIIQGKASPHDIWPASLIVEEAGGKATDLEGNVLGFPGDVNGVILSNGKAHKELLEIVAANTTR